MNLSLSRKRLEVLGLIGEETVQVVVEGTIGVPRQRPSIERILSLELVPEIDEIKPSYGAVEVIGSIDVSLLYISRTEEGEESLHSLEVKDGLSFKKVVDLADVSEGMEINARASLMEFNFEEAGLTEVDIDAVLNISVKAFKTIGLRVVTDAAGDGEREVKVSKETLQFMKTLKLQPETCMLEKILEVPPDLPLVERVIKPFIDLKVNGVQVLGGKVIVRGGVAAHVLYGTDSENEADSVQVFEKEVGEFACELGLPEGLTEKEIEGAPRIRASLANLEHEIVRDGEEVRIGVEVKVEGEVSQVKGVEVVTDLKSDGEEVIEVEATSVRVEGPLKRGSTRVTVEGVLEVEGDNGDIERVLRCTAVPLLNNCRVMDDVVFLEGNVRISAIYMTTSDEGVALSSSSSLVPFEASINIPGIVEGMSTLVEMKADQLTFHVAGGERIEMATGLTFAAAVSATNEVHIVTDAVVVRPVSRGPGLTIYMVQSGDTLWRISHRYGVDPAVLLSVNGLEGEEGISQGRKLLIPRS